MIVARGRRGPRTRHPSPTISPWIVARDRSRHSAAGPTAPRSQSLVCASLIVSSSESALPSLAPANPTAAPQGRGSSGSAIPGQPSRLRSAPRCASRWVTDSARGHAHSHAATMRRLRAEWSLRAQARCAPRPEASWRLQKSAVWTVDTCRRRLRSPACGRVVCAKRQFQCALHMQVWRRGSRLFIQQHGHVRPRTEL